MSTIQNHTKTVPTKLISPFGLSDTRKRYIIIAGDCYSYGIVEIEEDISETIIFISDDLRSSSTFEKGNLTHTSIEIFRLINYRLSTPISAILTNDNNGYLVRIPKFNLYGSGKTIDLAIDMLKREIESLYQDLMEDDNFSEQWLQVKDELKSIIIE